MNTILYYLSFSKALIQKKFQIISNDLIFLKGILVIPLILKWVLSLKFLKILTKSQRINESKELIMNNSLEDELPVFGFIFSTKIRYSFN